MFLIYLAAFIAACGAAKLDRTYLPPPSAALAGGSPGSLQVPLTKAIDQASQNVPPGGFINEHQGVVVEAATAGTRASSQQSGLGGSRDSYGSTDSKVGDAAFRTPSIHQNPNQTPNFGSAHGGDLNPDLSAFYQPMTSYRPGNVQIIRDYVSNTIKYHNDIDLSKFNYGFETNNGIKASESGVANNGVQVQGGYSYSGDDGRVYSVSYTADENGFRPHGSHLPTPPPIPIEILRSLEQNAKDEAAGIFDDGSYDAKKYNAGGDYTKSVANGEYNDRQSNKFGKRPGSTDGIGTFINQNQQAFVTSNFNGQFGFIHDTSKDKYNTVNDFNIMNNRNTFPKIEHKLINNGLGSRNEYLPPNRGQFESMFSAGGNKDSFSVSQSILQQNLQAQSQLNIVRPNPFETSPGIFSQAAFNSQISSLPSNNFNNQGSISDYSDKNIIPSIASQSYNKPLSEKPASSNILNQNPIIMQQSMSAPNNNKPIFTQDSFSQSVASVSAFSPQTQSAQQFISTNSPLQSTQNLNIDLPTTQFSTASSGSFNPSVNIMGQSQYAHIPVSSFDTSFSSVVPTGQPQNTLNTLFEPPKARDPSILVDSGKVVLLNATTAPDFTMTTQNIGLPTTQLSSAPSVSFNPIVTTIGQPQYSHIPIPSFDTSFSSVVPTVQPQITLSTPFEAPKMSEPSTLIDSEKVELINATTAPDFTTTNQNIGLSTTQLTSAPSVYLSPSVNTIGQPQYSHIPMSSFDTLFSSVVPTVQPQITLSTLFEAPKMKEYSNLLDTGKTELLNATTVTDFTMTTQNIRLPTTQLSSASSGYFDPSVNTTGQTQYTNIPSYSTDTSFSSSSFSVVPTVQPQITLTTPFETPKREPTTLLDSRKTELFHATTVPEFTVSDNQSSKLLMQTSSNKEQFPTQSEATISGNDFSDFSTSSFTRPQSTSQTFDNTQTTQISDDIKPQVTQVIFVSNGQGDDSVSTNIKGPTYDGHPNNFNGQTQAPDHSYTYNRPSIPFNTPFVVQQSNNFPSGLSQVTQPLTTPQDSTSTTQYQTQSTFSNSPDPTTLIPNISSYTLKENGHEKTTLEATSGITQASISPFPSTIFTASSNIKIPLQQSELSTPSQSVFPQPSTTSVTATTEILSTTLDNQKDYTQNQLFVEDKLNDGINKINNEQYSGEIYQYDKPVQALPPQPEKFSIKTERPQFAVSSSQFGQESSTMSMNQNNIQRGTQEPQTTFEAQRDSTVSEQSFSTRFSEQPSTQVTQADLNNNEYTISQSQQHTSPGIAILNYKPTISFPSTVPSNTLNTDKLDSQTSTTLSDNPTFGLQSTSQFEDSSTKETTSSYFQQPNQQTETQFNYQSSNSISGASQTTPEIKEHTQFMTISQGLGTESTAQFGHENFDNKTTTMPQFQQSVTQFTYKPSTSISNVDQSTFSGFNTQNPDKQFSFSTSFVPTTTDEPTQFSTQGDQGNFENKQTTISDFQTPSHQSSTTFSEPSTLIPNPAQTQTPPGTTQFGEIYDYKKPTEGLITPSQYENNAQFNQVNQFGIQSNMGPQMSPVLQKDNSIQFAQQTQQPQFATHSITQFNQKITEKETTQSHLSQSEAVTGIYNTGSTLVPFLPQSQTTSNNQIPDQTSTTGEIYVYTKPEQGLTSQSQGENGQLVQKNQEQQIGERTTIPVLSTFETKQTTTAQSTEAPTSTSATFQTQTNPNSQTTDTLTTQSVFTQETLLETKPSDSPQQFAFYSACCKGFKTESNQGSTSANEVQNILNKNMEQVAEMNKVEEKENLNLPVLQDAQKGSQTYAGIGEEFGGPRKPPSFDETGYHY